MAKSLKQLLLLEIDRRLSSPSCHFIDNSLAYYQTGDVGASEDDKEWLLQNLSFDYNEFIESHLDRIESNVNLKEFLYENLEDDYSRKILLLSALYDIMGHRFVRFPYHGLDNARRREWLASQYRRETVNAEIETLFPYAGSQLYYYDLPIGAERARLYTTPEFIYQIFNFLPYGYIHGCAAIKVENGDIVLDCGACVGDTALFFATQAGESGRVLSFEPHPFICGILRHNFRLNPRLASRMQFVQAATGAVDGETLELTFSGTGSHLGLRTAKEHTPVNVASLDAELERRKMGKVDFIKMDVEGAELASLKGAREAIKKFKPKLAICLYHKPEDFYEIPHYIKNINPGYRFYLEHHFVNNWETVLYAVAL